MLVSPPEAVIVGLFPVAPFANVISLTAEPVAVKRANSFPFVSKMEVPIGEVKVLFVSFVQSVLSQLVNYQCLG